MKVTSQVNQNIIVGEDSWTDLERLVFDPLIVSPLIASPKVGDNAIIPIFSPKNNRLTNRDLSPKTLIAKNKTFPQGDNALMK